MKTTNEFNEKYKNHLEEGHYGLDIEDERIIKYLDEIFEDLIKIEGFEYSQIKVKFGTSRVYTNLHQLIGKVGRSITINIENTIDILLKY